MMRGDRLKALREKRGYSHRELAKLLEMGSAQIWRYESGKNDPPGHVLARMARILDVSVDYLLGLTDEPHELGVAESNLSEKERAVVTAMRRGQNYEAIKVLVSED